MMTFATHLFNRLTFPLKNKRGATAVLTGIMLAVLVSFAALAIDIGYLTVTRNELQNVADAAALSGARLLGQIYEGDPSLGIDPMDYETQKTYDCDTQITYPGTGANDCAAIVNRTQESASNNKAAGTLITVNAADVEIGTWTPGAGGAMIFTNTTVQPDAVRVTARRDAGANGPINTFFAKVFNVDTMNVTAQATAALTGQSTAGPGDLKVPIGIPLSRFVGDPGTWCAQDVKFSPPGVPNCGAWTDLNTGGNGVSDKDIDDLINGVNQSPEITAGTTEVYFNNGNLSQGIYNDFLNQYKVNGFDVDEAGNLRVDADGNKVGPSADLTAQGIGPAVPLTQNTPTYDLPNDQPRQAPSSINPQLTYPCKGGNCTGELRYKHRWDTGVIVYNSSDCSPNSSESFEILGFAGIRLKDVLDAPDKTVVGEILCNYVDPGGNRGSGGSYGTKGSIPGLVR